MSAVRPDWWIVMPDERNARRRRARCGGCGRAHEKERGAVAGAPFGAARALGAHAECWGSTAHLAVITHLTSAVASSALTCGLAGIGICPQVPTLPSRTFFASLVRASLSLAYLAATSL